LKFDRFFFIRIFIDSLKHLFIPKVSENLIDPIYETIDHSPLSDTKNKSTSSNTFFSKTKDKFVTAVNKLVDNYGNIPKKQTYTNNLQQRSNNHSNEQIIPTNQKPASTKRQAPLAEHVLRRQEETRPTSEVTYENTTNSSSITPVPRRSSISTPTKNSVIFAH
jgi:hypothetical protein